MEEVMNITNVNPNNNYDSSASLNKYSFKFRICDISLPQYQIGYVYFQFHQNIPPMFTLDQHCV